MRRMATVVRTSRFNSSTVKTARARRLRRDATEVERRLWQKLRGAQIGGASFRRQHPAGRYILDFYCPALQLAIELDGGQHGGMESRDRERDEWLAQQGVTVLRFWNSDVVENMPGVLEARAAKLTELKARQANGIRRWRRGPDT